MSGARFPPIFPLDQRGKEQSQGERTFYEAFGRDDGCRQMTLLHSVFISRHIKNISGEIDMVILAPGKGIFLIEVKHGRLSKEDGVWYTTGKRGKFKLRVSPFCQLQDTARSLETWLKERLTDPALTRKYGAEAIHRMRQMRMGNGFVFSSEPDWQHRDTEHEPWMVMTAPMLGQPNGVSGFVDRLSRNYELLPAWQRSYVPDEQVCNYLRDILMGDLEVRYGILERFADEERALESLTQEQLKALANTRYNNRCFFEGGAGTGKTVLAVELFLEKANPEKHTALFCYNKNLARHLSDHLSKVEGVDLGRDFVGTLPAYMLKQTGLEVPPPEGQDKFFKQDLVDAFFAKEMEPQFDHIIVDEIQDLLSVEYLWVIDAMLKGGLAQGNWTFFGDLSNQLIYKEQQQVKEALDLLGQTASFYRSPPLQINCRSTRNIGMSLPDHTGCAQPLFPDMAPDGTGIVHRFPATVNKRNEELEGILAELTAIQGKDIAILAPRREVLEEIGKLAFVRNKGCRLETIHSFKGLESKVVILLGFTSLLDEDDIHLLYVGMSRARLKLYFVLDGKLQDDYRKLLKRFISLT